jgi:hypothetical protein
MMMMMMMMMLLIGSAVHSNAYGNIGRKAAWPYAVFCVLD